MVSFNADMLVSEGDVSYPAEVDVEVDGEDVEILEVRDDLGTIRCDLVDEAWAVLNAGAWDDKISAAQYRDVVEDD